MIEIIEATSVDVTFVVENMRADDREEIFCQLPEGFDEALLAKAILKNKPKAALLKGEPVGLYWLAALTCSTAFVSLFGTDKINRAVPAMTREIFTVDIPEWRERGFRRFEARSHIEHRRAHKWLIACGAQVEGELKEMGRNGESFLMFGLTGAMIDNHELKRWQDVR